MLKKYLLLSLVSGLLFVSCSSNKSSKNALSGTIKIDGSSTVYPITEAVAEQYRSVQPDVRVTAGSSGSGAGFKKFARGETDISDASRAITDEETQACHENGIQFKELKVALDGIAIVVNPNNDWIDDISVAQLKKIWQPDSKVKTWSDIDSSWPDQEIHLFGPNTAHGTYDFFTEEIMGESGASRSDYNSVSDYNVAVQGISTDKYALGYFGLAYYEENMSKLKLLGVIDNGGDPVKPSTETVSSGTYTPLSRPLFIYVSKKAAQRKEVQSFVNFYLTNADSLAKAVGYVQMPQSAYDTQQQKFKDFYTQAESK